MTAKKRRSAKTKGRRKRVSSKKPKLGVSLLAMAGAIAILVSIIIGITAFYNEPVFAIADAGTGAIIGVAIIASAMNSYTAEAEKSDKWAVVALILYLIEIPSAWGFGIGIVMALAGAMITLRS